ncbi:MAG: hypothetical protein NC121_14465 [Blautia sp.]|nr:hypothetical protein [Acetatifactor muris]MCM1542444.1 hypothetical protein [Blautia sp.]
MDSGERKQKNFVGYEYKEVLTEGSRFSFLLDGYENFGWELDESLPDNRESRSPALQQKTVLRLKRDRKIINKVELTRLERNFEACVDEIEKLERAKSSTAAMYALILGVIGTAFMAGSVFAVTAQSPHYILCIILAVPGFSGWILPYFLYKKIVEKRTEKMTPLIEAKYDEIYEICEKGNKLLR